VATGLDRLCSTHKIARSRKGETPGETKTSRRRAAQATRPVSARRNDSALRGPRTRRGAQNKPKSGPRAADQTQANETDAEQCGRSGFGNVRHKGHGVDDGAAVGECPSNGGGILNSSGLVNEKTGHRIEDWTTFYIRYKLNRPTTLNEGEEEHVADGAKPRFTYIQGTQTSRDTYGIRRAEKLTKHCSLAQTDDIILTCRIDDCDIIRNVIERNGASAGTRLRV
jgi:hypothetical protein